MLSLSKQIDHVLRTVYKKRLSIIALKAANILISILPPVLTGRLVDDLSNNSGQNAITYIVIIASILVVYFFVDWGQDYFWYRMEYIGTGLVRTYIFANVIRKNYKFFKEHNVGELESKIVHDSELYAQSKLSMIPMLLLNIMHIVIIVGILMFTNFIMALAVIGFSVIFYLVYKAINKRLRKAALKEREGLTDVLTSANEILTGAPTIQVYGETKYFTRRFADTVDKYEYLLIRLRKWKGLALASTNKIVGLLPLAVAFAALGLYASGVFTAGYIVTFYLLLPHLADPIKALTEYNIDTQNAKVVRNRLEEMLSEKRPKRLDLVSINNIDHLEFHEINYEYVPNTPVLKFINFTLKKGESLAVVGPLGSGKSTFLRMLKRQIIPTNGQVLINSIDLHDIAEKSYLNRVTIVSQEIFIFDDTIRENIKFGKDVSEEKIAKIVQKCALEHLSLDENAVNLSTGEKHLLGLARALACEYDILILDEPTAELDAATETRIIQTIKEVQEKTECMLIIVTHSNEVLEKLCDKMLILGEK